VFKVELIVNFGDLIFLFHYDFVLQSLTTRVFPINPLPILREEFHRENSFRIDFSSYSILPLELLFDINFVGIKNFKL
jgi:hypothetical protein